MGDGMNSAFEYVFPAIQGVQSGREYYVSMCPLRLVTRMLVFNGQEVPAHIRAQRQLNRARLPELKRYIVNNRDNYVFSAITASINGDVVFEPHYAEESDPVLGRLHVPMDAQFVINDGQHRQAAIAEAIKECPELGSETIAVVFFIDAGLARSQQMFADLNRYAIRPSSSLGVLYDHRDKGARLTKLVVFKSPVFQDFVETEKNLDELAATASEFWECVDRQIPQWAKVRAGVLTASEVRQDFIHSYGIGLHAIGKLGNTLLRTDAWRSQLKGLLKVDWARSSTNLWEGRAMIGGRVSKALHNVTLTTNVLKKACGVPLNADEERVEKAFRGGSRGKKR